MMLTGGVSIIGVLFRVNFSDFANNSDAFKSFVDSVKDVGVTKTDVIVIIENGITDKREFLNYDYTVQ